MDYLCEELGDPPFRCDQIVNLTGRAAALANTIGSGLPFHPREALRMLDMLQQLLNIAGAGGLAKILPELRPPCFERLLGDLPIDLLVLREELFQRLDLPALHRPDPGAAAAICHHCNWALEHIGRKPRYYGGDFRAGHIPQYLLEADAWPDFPSLKQRAGNGCAFCGLIRDALQSFDVTPASFRRGLNLVSIRFLWHEDRLTGFAVVLNSGLDVTAADDDHSKEFYIESRDDRLVSELHLARPRQENPLHPANLAFIRQNLELADSLAQWSGNGFIPKRLVDVGTTPESCPALAAPAGPASIKYATLSYCWGPPADAAMQLKTTTINWKQHQLALPQDTMPAIIMDAIAICRAVGIRYIWIDALCILQGSDGDWEEQSAQMCDIFGNSYLTICAVASRSCLEGMLGQRKPPALTLSHGPRLYEIRPVLFDRGRLGRYSIESAAPLVQDLVSSAWTQRGWVYQEKCLSTRKLYFGKNQIHFQTGDRVVSENGHIENIGNQDPRLHRDWPKNVDVKHLRGLGRYAKDYWYELVEQVCYLQWTVRLDVFPSISGLASRFRAFVDGAYLAGLWADDLHCGLLWRPGNPPPYFPRPAQSIPPESLTKLLDELEQVTSVLAPSWSWASRGPGRCTFVLSTRTNSRCRVRTHLRREFDLVESRVRVENIANPFGRLRPPASLRLSGRTTALGHRIEHLGDELVSVWQNGMLAELLLDWGDRSRPPANVDAESHARLLMLLVSSCCSEAASATSRAGTMTETDTDMRAKANLTARPDYGRSFFQDNQPEETARLNCSLCLRPEAPRDAWGLLVHPGPSDRPGPLGRYFRVGVFTSRAAQGGTALFEGSECRELELV